MRCWRRDYSLLRRLETSAWTRRPIAARALPRSSRDRCIEGRIIYDLIPIPQCVWPAAAASELPESDELVRETVCELANQVTGNAITALNDQGFHFRVHPPVLHTLEHGSKSSEDTEALVICFETASGNVFMNIALRYNRRRQGERAAAAKQ